jgi:hypothetical protein
LNLEQGKYCDCRLYELAGNARVQEPAANWRKAKEVLVWAKHTRKWEFARQELPHANDIARGDTRAFWVRRDYSTICPVGEEIATLPVPPPPKVEA